MTTYDDNAPAIAVFFLGPAIMAAIFGAVSLLGGSPVTPEIYGPKVYEIPALLWAGTQLALSLLAVFATLKRLHLIAALAAFGLTALFILFAAMALQAGATGTLLIAMAVGTAPICAVFGSWAWRAHRGGR